MECDHTARDFHERIISDSILLLVADVVSNVSTNTSDAGSFVVFLAWRVVSGVVSSDPPQFAHSREPTIRRNAAWRATDSREQR